jgi:hypothetical protein
VGLPARTCRDKESHMDVTTETQVSYEETGHFWMNITISSEGSTWVTRDAMLPHKIKPFGDPSRADWIKATQQAAEKTLLFRQTVLGEK